MVLLNCAGIESLPEDAGAGDSLLGWSAERCEDEQRDAKPLHTSPHMTIGQAYPRGRPPVKEKAMPICKSFVPALVGIGGVRKGTFRLRIRSYSPDAAAPES